MSEHVIDVYQDARNEYRWRIRAENGSILADSGEGYKNKADCLHGLFGLFFGAYDDTFLTHYAEWQQYKDSQPHDLAQAPVGKVEVEPEHVAEKVDEIVSHEPAPASVEGPDGAR